MLCSCCQHRSLAPTNLDLVGWVAVRASNETRNHSRLPQSTLSFFLRSQATQGASEVRGSCQLEIAAKVWCRSALARNPFCCQVSFPTNPPGPGGLPRGRVATPHAHLDNLDPPSPRSRPASRADVKAETTPAESQW